MKNFIQPGNSITAPVPYAVQSGDGVLIGALFGIAANSVAEGAETALATTGVFDLTKVAAQAWTLGAAVYWDNTARKCTTVATDNTRIGVAVQAASNPSAAGHVRLNGGL
jgi:predicted RecA/RadA family phage recombinase